MQQKMKCINYQQFIRTFVIFISIFTLTNHVNAEEEKDIYKERMSFYEKTEALTQIPWYYLAAIDQYERNIQKDIEKDTVISIKIPEEKWFGMGNTSNIKDEHLI